MDFGRIFQESKFLPSDAQLDLIQKLKTSQESNQIPAGAVLVVIHLLETLGIPRFIDATLKEEHTPIEMLKKEYRKSRGKKNRIPPMPSSGIILSLLIADMMARPKTFSPIYKIQQAATRWKTGELLGICPSLLNDDRILKILQRFGSLPDTMRETLQLLVCEVSKRYDLPLQRFYLDTTVLQLDGKFSEADKVTKGRGKDSFSQLIAGLVIAAGSRVPVAFAVLSGNSFDAKYLPKAFQTVDQTIPSESSIELVMDRIFPTPSNIRFLQSQNRPCFWVSPLKSKLAGAAFSKKVFEIWEKDEWEPISYRSSKEKRVNLIPPLTAHETEWILTETIKPELQKGQTRRPKGSIERIEIPVRCVIYRHELRAKQEQKQRKDQRQACECELKQLKEKLNKYKLITVQDCEAAGKNLLKKYTKLKKFLELIFTENEHKAVAMSWKWDEEAIEKEAKLDGIFALMTNHDKEIVSSDALIQRYRERDQIEVSFKDLRGILNLERIFIRIPERIDAYLFLKCLAYFALAFVRWYLEEKSGKKMTEAKIQEQFGDMNLSEGMQEPLGLPDYTLGNDTDFLRWIRKEFELPDPLAVIKELNNVIQESLEEAIRLWFQEWKKEKG